jgi:hypothetical protein
MTERSRGRPREAQPKHAHSHREGVELREPIIVEMAQ